MGKILPIVLARLGVGVVPSEEPGETTSTAPGSRAENAYRPQGANPKKSMALSRITNAGTGTVGLLP